jgi:hypothetical protein
MIKYYLPNIDLTKFYSVFIGDRKRYATCTGVSFVNEDLILVASYFGKKIYLVNIPKNSFDIVNQYDTEFFIDLIDYRDGLITTTHLPHKTSCGSISLLSLNGNEISLIKNIKLNGTTPHGCTIINNSTLIVSNMADYNRGSLLLDIDSEKYSPLEGIKYYPKDACIYGDKLFILSIETRPKINSPTNVGKSLIYLYDLNSLTKIDEMEFFGQSDGITVNGNNGFITIQDQDSLQHFLINDNKLILSKMIPGFNFPHGISSFGNKVAITNYGDNSVDIYDLEELITD